MNVKYEYPPIVVRKRGPIPHWHVPRGLYFVTWRLHDSIRPDEAFAMRNLRERLLTARKVDPSGAAALAVERDLFRLLERSLDRGTGVAYMNDPAVADMVQRAPEYGDGLDYELISDTVMPNHVHVVFRLLGELDAVLQQWKSFTSHQANRLLKRHGQFWADDYFDVLIRDTRQFARTVAYVQDNPWKAELMDWRWSRTWRERYAECV